MSLPRPNLARCESSFRQLPVVGRIAYPMRAKVTTHVRLGHKKSLGCPVSLTCSGRNDLGGKQTVRPEHNEIAATSKTSPRKIVFAETSEKPTNSPFWEGRRHGGRTRQMHSMGLAGVRAQAAQDRFAEITSGRSWCAAGAGSNRQRLLQRGEKPKERRAT